MKKYNILFVLLIIVATILSCSHEDSPTDILPTSIQLSETSFSLVVDGREKILTTTTPSNATLSTAKWSSSNPTIATVDSSGVITALTVGITTINLTVGSLSENCTLKVVTSPITQLVMPEAKYPIANGAIIFLQGTGFTANQKIWLRKNNTDISAKVPQLSAPMKAGKANGDILATIHDQAASCISFYATITNAGWYSVILDNDTTQFNLGNIQISTQVVPEYTYDKNKIYWDDTHWRKMQLKGSVKTITTKADYYPYWVNVNTFAFNKNGYIESYAIGGYDGTKGNANLKVYSTYQYDSQNRLILKLENSNVHDGNGTIDKITCKYNYGNHSQYLPIDFDWYASFSTSYDNVELVFNNRFNLSSWQRGLTSINMEKHYASNNIVTINYVFNVFKDSIYTIDSNDKKTVWYYNNSNLPFKSNRSSDLSNTTYLFSTNGLPLELKWWAKGRESNVYYRYWIKDRPFMLFSEQNDDGYIKSYEYDKNWDLLKYNEGNNSHWTYNYQSYDSNGNWTQCMAIERNANGKIIQTEKFTRDIIYW